MSTTGSGPADVLSGPGRVVLDASFILAVLDEEDGVDDWFDVLARGEITSVTAGEVFYKTAARGSVEPGEVESLLSSLGIDVVDLHLRAARHFPALRAVDAARRAQQKERNERAASLSMADLCVLGHAISVDLPVLTGDQHWSTLHDHGLSVDVYQFRGDRR